MLTIYPFSKAANRENMINRIWNGEVGLGWAFWGVGLGGFALPLGVLLFWWMLLGEGSSFSFANLVFIILGFIPTVVVYDLDLRNSSLRR